MSHVIVISPSSVGNKEPRVGSWAGAAIDGDTSTGEALEAIAGRPLKVVLVVVLTTLTLVTMAALAELASLKRARDTELAIMGWGAEALRTTGAAGRRTGVEAVMGLSFSMAALQATGMGRSGEVMVMGGEVMAREGTGPVSRHPEALPAAAGLGALTTDPEVSRLVANGDGIDKARETGTRTWRGVLPPLLGAARMV